jgi:dienelactone hydrolase
VTFDSSGNVTSNQTPLDPTTSAGLTELQGLATLYKADQPLLQFLEAVTGKGASDILLAWDFTTQVTVDPLNPSLAGSPASTTSSRTFGTLGSLPAQAGVDTQTYLVGALGSANCAAVGCAAVGDVVGGLLNTVNYQTTQTNPDGGSATPGPWNDPVHPTQQSTPQIQALIFLPAGSPPTGGWPFVIFGHGLGEQKEDLFAIAPQLAAAGYATAAVDDVDSGSRAIQTSTTAALGCSGTPTYSAQPQCFTQILSTDLATTRDNIRQTVLDYLSLSAALKACGTSGCAYVSGTSGTVVAVNGAKLGYVGQSLGGIIGTTFSASSNDIKAAVLNVPGVGLLDILENTANLSIRCSLVNGLINAGVVTGDLYTGGSTGLCLTEDWQKQASYQQFASVARWVLDPADGANYLAKLAPKKFIIQEVDNDQVVPNIATNNEGMLLGLTAGSASDALPASASSPPAPSSGVAGSPRLWLKYFTTASHAYQHGSLLSPVASQAGLLGTEQMQVDAITFMALNNH